MEVGSEEQQDPICITSRTVSAAKQVQECVRCEWYKPSQEVETFEHSYKILELFHRQVSTGKVEHTLEVNGIRSRLEEAVKLLDDELKRCKSKVARGRFHCWGPSSRARSFPQGLASMLQALSHDIADIPGLELHERGIEDVEQISAKLPFGADSKYVPLAGTLKEVIQSLEDEAGPPVVVIYGEPGAGKSSLVKYLGLMYQNRNLGQVRERISMADPIPPPCVSDPRRSPGSSNFMTPLLSSKSPSVMPLSRKSVRMKSTSPKRPSNSVLRPSQITPLSMNESPNREVAFEHGVFFIHCGQGADVESKQLELSKILGLPFATPKDETLQHKPPFSLRCQSLLRKHIRKRLNKRRALVILDDVWDADLVEKLIIPGIQVKYLVTSQNSEIWEGTKVIQIGRVSLEEARVILAQHIGFESGNIPVHLMEVADEMIEVANRNPLALVNMAIATKAVYSPRVDEVGQMRSMLKHFETEMEVQGKSFALGSQIGSQIPCRASMVLALESVPHEALKLLMLTVTLDGLYVPEVVVRLLYSSINKWESSSSSKFFRWKTYLEGWSWISVQGQSVGGSGEPVDQLHFYTWYVHGVRKRMITEMEMENFTCITNGLIDFCATDKSDERETLIAVLYNLYSNPLFGKQISNNLGLPTLIKKTFKRNIIEPFVYLLHPEADEDWKQSTNDRATKVILNIILGDELDDESLAQLLQIPQVVDTVCMALCVFGEQQTRVSMRLPGALERTSTALVKIFAESESISTQRVALDAFIALTQFDSSCKSKNLFILAASPGALERLELMLADEKDPIRQCRAAGVLGNISKYHEMAVGKLMGLLSSGKPERIQRCASSAFASLAPADDNKILPFLKNLVDLLDRNVPESVQWPAAVGLVNLSTTDENRARMLAFPGVLAKLVDLLDREVAEIVQHYAAWAIANLAVAEGNQVQMAEYPKLLPALLASLEEDVPENVQFQAARAVGNLSRAQENHIYMAIFPNALERFVNLLDKDVPQSIQEHAAKAFACLSAADENKIIMGTYPNAVSRLIGLLDRSVSPEVQLYAVWSLANLAVADENKSRLGSAPGALEMLAALLERDVAENIQEHAARAFANLASAHENKTKMVFLPGALERVVSLLLNKSAARGVQRYTILTFAKLAMANDDEVKIRMATSPRSIEALVGLLSRDVPEKIQQDAAWAFASLALEKQNREPMATYPKALEKLLGLLSNDVSGSVQRQAARALTILDLEIYLDRFLKSPESLIGRGSVLLDKGLYEGALADFNKAYELWPEHEEILWLRAFAKVKSTDDCDWALKDLDIAVKIAPNSYVSWQERGVLKHMMGDLQGALADLNRAMEISWNSYEVYKHRGFVKYCLGDKLGARADAEKAILFTPMRVETTSYCNSFLGMQPVEFLEYKFK